MFRYSLAMLVGLSAAATASAANWAEAMFEGLTRDFGSVPRGPTLTHPFRLTNNTGSAVTISNIRVSCGCTTARALRTQLAPGQSTAILAEMDTGRFQREKTVTIYVQFSEPRFEEVRLLVQANSRDDVTVAPESVAFGQVKKGGTPSAAVTVTFSGNEQWRITGVTAESNYVKPSIKLLPGSSVEVNYQLTAKLRSDTPVGKWFTDIWLSTNNPATPRVRVPLTVEVQAALSLSPSAVILGQVKVGEQTERKIIVRGARPFKVVGVKGADSQWTVHNSSQASKTVHVLTVSLKATRPGEINRTIKVVTDLEEDNEIEFQAQALVEK
jgi:hypothetical protein